MSDKPQDTQKLTKREARPRRKTREELTKDLETAERTRGELAAEVTDLRKRIETMQAQHASSTVAERQSSQKIDETHRREMATLLRIGMDAQPYGLNAMHDYGSARETTPAPSWFVIAHAIGRVMAQRDAYSELRAEALAAQSLTNVVNHA